MIKRIQLRNAIYNVTVEGSGESVILLHGFTGSHRTWKTCTRKWTDRHKVVAIDLPEHGETIVQHPRTMEQFCTDLQLILDELLIEQATLVGYSMGGRVALSFALLYPERVHKLILESASPGLQTEAERQKRREADSKLANHLVEQGIESFVTYWENIPLFATQKKLPSTIQNDIRTERLSQKAESLARSLLFMGTGSQPSWWERLGELTIPICQIVGKEDHKFVKLNKEMNKRFRTSELHIVEETGHAIHVEQPEKFAKIVREFINKNYT